MDKLTLENISDAILMWIDNESPSASDLASLVDLIDRHMPERPKVDKQKAAFVFKLLLKNIGDMNPGVSVWSSDYTFEVATTNATNASRGPLSFKKHLASASLFLLSSMKAYEERKR